MSNPPTVVMVAPPTWGGPVTNTPSGEVYQPDNFRLVQAQYQDIPALASLGFVPISYNDGLIGYLLSANMNTTSDQAVTMLVNPNSVFVMDKALVTNASASLTTAVGGVYTAASKGGVAVLANSTAYSGLTTSAKAIEPTVVFNRNAAGVKLYLSLSTAQGAAATADFYFYGKVLPQ